GMWTVASLVLTAAAPGLPSDVEPFKSRKVTFPIRIDDGRQQEIASLRLYYSTDRGSNWVEAAVAKPGQAAFQPTVPADGLYWFAIQVVDHQNNREPAKLGPANVAWKVLVDTLKPDVALTLVERKGDAVTVSWVVREEYPN